MRVRVFKFLHYNRGKSIYFTTERKNVLTRREKLALYLNPGRKIEIPFIDLDVNTVCDLKCRKCAKLTPYFEKKVRFSAEKVIEDLNSLLRYVDTIYALSIIGGEPFLNQDIGRVIAYCSQCSKIRDVDITTNATVVPKDDVFQALAESRVVVHVSDYKLKNPVWIENKKVFMRKLEQYRIPYEYFSHESWLDFGPVEKQHHTKRRLKMMYYCCPMNSCNIYNDGKLYRCGRASYIGNHQLGELEDVIDVREIHSRAQMRRQLKKFYRRSYSSACEYCSAYPEDVVPGVQMGE